MDLFRSTMKPVKKVMEDADLTKKDIDEIVLVGGSTRIPKIQQLVKVRFLISDIKIALDSYFLADFVIDTLLDNHINWLISE